MQTIELLSTAELRAIRGQFDASRSLSDSVMIYGIDAAIAEREQDRNACRSGHGPIDYSARVDELEEELEESESDARREWDRAENAEVELEEAEREIKDLKERIESLTVNGAKEIIER